MEVLICPTCRGEGWHRGLPCGDCKGAGRLAPFGSDVLFWSKRLSSAGIAERKFEAVARGVVYVLLLVIGLGGIAAVVVEGFLRADAAFTDRIFWTAPSARLLLFYLTIWTDAYLVARMIRDTDRLKPVKARRYGEGGESAARGWADAASEKGKGRIDVARSFNFEAFAAVERAYELARKGGFGEAVNAHLFAALLRTPDVSFLFARLEIATDRVVAALQKIIAASPPKTGETLVAEELWQTIFFGYAIAFETRAKFVRPLELFLALARTPGRIQEMLFNLGADEKKIENVTAWVRIAAELRARYHKGRAVASSRPKGGMNRAMTAIATPALDSLSEDYTARAVYGALPPFVGREKEMAALFRMFEGGGRSVLLVGHHGTGKEAMLEGLAERMAAEDVPAVLRDKRLVALSIPKLVAGAGAADAALRLENVFYEVAVSRNIILAIPGVEGLVGISTGSGGGIDLSEILEANISKYGVLTVATTTPEDYAGRLERSAIGRGFEKLELEEVGADDAIRICEAKAGRFEAQNNVWFSYDAIEKAVVLSARYLHERYLPEKAIEILSEAAYAVRSQRGENAVVSGEDVAELVSEKSKVPVTTLTASESEKLLGLEDRMHGRVVGQDEAVNAVARAIRRARTELRAGARPIANFLFLGPTGVGKTELAKTVAEIYFGNESTMIRLDMSEYQEQNSLGRLLGVPGGKEGGQLTEAVRRAPFALLLLDEIEKAHPDILNVFLQVMDDGRLTDNAGRTIDFTNVILIMTSNAGSQFIQDSIRGGRGIDEIKEELVGRELKGIFRPEFLNRFDGVIVFRPLSEANVLQIARLMVIGLAKQLEAKQISLQASEEALAELAAAGFDPVFGARPLRRVIQEKVQDALAEAMLQGKIGRRDTVVLEKGGELRIIKAAGA